MKAKRIAIPTALTRPDVSPRQGAIRRVGGQTMGTVWSARFVAGASLASDEAQARVQAALDLVIAQMSPWEEGSDLSRYNRAPAGSWIDAPQDFMTVLDAALAVAAETGGAYDPACGALVDLWGFGPAPKRDAPPAPALIEAARARPGCRHVGIDRAGQRLFQPGGASLTFSSIAKGYGVDLAGAALDALGADAWLVEVGGELKARGVKPNGEPWWVSLDATGESEPAGGEDFIVALCDLAVATSGDGVYSFQSNGRRYSHIIDPRTGYPATHDLAVVSVLHESAMLADAYATAIFVLGPEEGAAFAETRSLAARLVRHDGREIVTAALDAMLD
ncbi:MAG: FAD:protein FMN transferase [Amphiplicatus sp.]